MAKLLEILENVLRLSSREISYQEARYMYGLTYNDIPEVVVKKLQLPDIYDVSFSLRKTRNGEITGEAYAQFKTAKKVDGIWKPDKRERYPIHVKN